MSFGVEEGFYNNDDDEYRFNYRFRGDSIVVNGVIIGVIVRLRFIYFRRFCKDRINIRIYASNVIYYL